MNTPRYRISYAVGRRAERSWRDVFEPFNAVPAAVGAAASIERMGFATRIVNSANPDRRDLYPRHGGCSNANRGTFGHECGKPATWLGTRPDGFQSGRCDRCKVEGDERFGFVFEALPRQSAAAFCPVTS